MKKYSLLLIAFIGLTVCVKAQSTSEIAKTFVQDISTAKYHEALALTDTGFQKAVSETEWS